MAVEKKCVDNILNQLKKHNISSLNVCKPKYN